VTNMHSKQTAAFLVLDGEVSGVDPQVVLVETTDGRHELLRTDQLEGWYGLGGDGVARVLRGPTRLNQHTRPVLRRIRPPLLRGQRTVHALYGSK
jgi:hypothetical protein